MKLKYYLRGLGIGIICTAIIMGIALSGNKKETMTDTEIIERARLLGMVMPEDVKDDSPAEEEKTPSDDKDSRPETGDKNAGSKKDNQAESDKKADSQLKTDKAEDSQSKTDKAEDSKKDDNKTQKEETDKKTDSQQNKNQPDKASDSQQKDTGAAGNGTAQKPSTQEMVEIEIKAGDYSAAVSQTLKQAGLITDADAFNKYLTQKGVDQNLRVGVYQIPKGATQDEIIEILQK